MSQLNTELVTPDNAVKYQTPTTNQMHTQSQKLFLSRINAAQHVSGNMPPIIRSPFQIAVAASGFCIEAEVDVFPAVVCLLVWE
jgi:hypothetical protein